MTRPAPLRKPLQRTKAAALLCLVVAPCFASMGCRGPLFPAREPRSQYDRYDRARGEHAPARIEDEFGASKPNLSGRLGGRN